MFIVNAIHAVLQQDGYQARVGDGGTLSFRYYGQEASFLVHQIGAFSVGEVACQLPRALPAPAQLGAFLAARPLARCSEQDGRVRLSLQSLLSEQGVAEQVRQMLGLFDQYVGDLVVGTFQAAPASATPLPPPTASGTGMETLAFQAAPAPTRPPSEATALPAGWADFMSLMHENYRPLARALAALNVPAPDEVQMDMLQGQQVKGTAVMMWGAPPNAVVVCEPGQPVPPGYQGSTWLKHLTVEQVAQETRAHLQAAGRL